MKKITIGVTDCHKFENYARWIQAHSLDIEIIKLSEKTHNLADATKCQGIVFTGGEDVHPRFYNKPEYLPQCHQDDINEARDEFEMTLMDYTQENAVPVLGICRGLQLYNVFRGGTLIPDIPTWFKGQGKVIHAKSENGLDRYHSTLLTSDSWLGKLIGISQGEINSNHHQSIDRMGGGLVVSAISEDGIIEAVDQKEPEENKFICLVQWHPERMKDQQSPFVRNIRNAFIQASKNLV